MDAPRFDALTRRFLGDGASRRSVLGGVSAVLGLGVLPAAANKNKDKKPKKNAFGCLNVGKPCNGKNKKCCSGICKGKKPKKGERDKSECVGHDESTCSAGQQILGCGGTENPPCTTSQGLAGSCTTTTGNAGYCFSGGECFPCSKDSDCEAFCGPQAACTQCSGTCAAQGGTACVGVGACTF